MQQPYATQRISFESDGCRCAGVLYRPAGDAAARPCVVMAHGFSGTMDWIVPDFAERFAGARAAHHEIREYPVGHFDVYHGAVRDEVAHDQLVFLQRHLMPTVG